MAAHEAGTVRSAASGSAGEKFAHWPGAQRGASRRVQGGRTRDARAEDGAEAREGAAVREAVRRDDAHAAHCAVGGCGHAHAHERRPVERDHACSVCSRLCG